MTKILNQLKLLSPNSQPGTEAIKIKQDKFYATLVFQAF